MPTFAERLVHAPGDASGLRVHPTAFSALGGLICGENTNPLARFTLFAQDEAIHVASWLGYPLAANEVNREGAGLRSRGVAFEGKVFVLAASGLFDERTADVVCDTEERRRMVTSSGGCSAIVGPDGNYLAGPLTEGEGILVAALDLEWIVTAKIVHDVAGHYNRPDLFTLTVDRRPHTIARFTDLPALAGAAGDGRPEVTPPPPKPDEGIARALRTRD